MQIREEQLIAFQADQQAAFRERLSKFLRQELPEETADFDDRALMELIIVSEQRAKPYGIVSEAGIAQFVCLTFALGPEFDEVSEVHAYLMENNPDDSQASGEEKLDALVERLSKDDAA